jgi:CRISPR-associated protein Csc2
MTLTETVRDALADGTVSELIRAPENNYTNILVLRELKSHAVFTTNGQDADIATVSLSDDDESIEYSPGLMFMRKQTGSDRRFAKALQRDLVGIEDTMDVNKMNQSSPESVLYGSAASESEESAVSVTSRVMYDTAYTVRDATAVIDEKFQNAPGDEYVKEATSAIREPDFFEPGSLFPSVITLRDATPEEVTFVLGITLQNKRYGATTTRLGRVKNHVLDVYVGSEEGPANLELSQALVHNFADDLGSLNDAILAGSLDTDAAKEYTKMAFDRICDSESLSLEPISQQAFDELRAIATDDDKLSEILKTQADAAEAFIENAE